MKTLTFASGTGRRFAMNTGAVILTVAAMLSACDGGASTPTSPTVTSTVVSASAATYTLSGTVSEMRAAGSAPIEGARVMAVNAGRATATDANGFYSVPGLPPTSGLVSVIKDGYLAETRTVTMSGDTQLDVQLERLSRHTLSGVVFEITAEGRVPIEGVEVYCDSCGSPDGHTFVYTDASGFYSLDWASNGVHPLFVTKAGYAHPASTLLDAVGRVRATVSGDTRFDVELVRQ